jgi:hypothetical protein
MVVALIRLASIEDVGFLFMLATMRIGGDLLERRVIFVLLSTLDHGGVSGPLKLACLLAAMGGPPPGHYERSIC